MKRIRKRTPLLLVLVAGLIFASRSFFLETLITPLAFLFWGAWRLIASVDQAVIWTGLVVLCGGLATWLLLPRRVPGLNRAYQEAYRPPSRFEGWRQLLAESRHGGKEAEFLRKSMVALLTDVLARDGNGALPDMEARVAARDPSLSPAARAYLFPPRREKLDFLAALRNKLGGHIADTGGTQKANFWGGGRRAVAVKRQEAVLDEVLRWMELELGARFEQLDFPGTLGSKLEDRTSETGRTQKATFRVDGSPMNRKSRLVTGLICGLILAAMAARNGELLLLALPALVYLLAGALQAPAELRLAAQRRVANPSARTGEAVEIGLVVTNQGTAAVHLALEDRLPPGMRLLSGQPGVRLCLAAGESVAWAYVASAQRGSYTWQALPGRASDPLGLFEKPAHIPANGHLLVVPAPLDIRPLALTPRFTAPTAGSLPAGREGSGTDFWGTREYRPGDPLRRINWRLAGRHPRKYFTNQYEHQAIADFGLILDARRLTSDLALEADLFERMVSAAAALGKNFLRNGNRVSLLVFGETIQTISPASGKRQLDLLLRNLACAQQGGHLSLATIEHFPPRLFPPRALLVVLSRVDPRDLNAYARLRAAGYEVILISPDPVALAAQGYPASTLNAPAARAAGIERRLQLARLEALGVRLVDWPVDQPLEPLVRAAALQMRYRSWH